MEQVEVLQLMVVVVIVVILQMQMVGLVVEVHQEVMELAEVVVILEGEEEQLILQIVFQTFLHFLVEEADL